jgi:hypothetical protein
MHFVEESNLPNSSPNFNSEKLISKVAPEPKVSELTENGFHSFRFDDEIPDGVDSAVSLVD